MCKGQYAMDDNEDMMNDVLADDRFHDMKNITVTGQHR